MDPSVAQVARDVKDEDARAGQRDRTRHDGCKPLAPARACRNTWHEARQKRQVTSIYQMTKD